MIVLNKIAQQKMEINPYKWAIVDQLFHPSDALALTSTYPHDHYKTVIGYDGEKGYEYDVRSLVHMGSDQVTRFENLSPAWQKLSQQLISNEYRETISRLSDLDLLTVPIEINAFHFGQGAWQGAHLDLKDKIITHILYFNTSWSQENGGCLSILRSKDMSDVETSVLPIVGNSAILVRSEQSWHAVTPVSKSAPITRRSITVTFYHPGSASTMWPAHDMTPLHHHNVNISNDRY